MNRILFVCHGNICRSPMAEFVMKDLVEANGVAEQFHIESAATSTEELGNDIHHGTKRVLDRHHIQYKRRGARQMTRADYDEYDLLVGMDFQNIRRMNAICGGDPHGKIHLLLDFAGEHRNIADPWYTGDFETTYQDVIKGCTALLDELLR